MLQKHVNCISIMISACVGMFVYDFWMNGVGFQVLVHALPHPKGSKSGLMGVADNFYTSFCVPGLVALPRKLWSGACLASLQVHCLSTYHLGPKKQLKLLIRLHLWQFTQDSTAQQ